MNRQELNEILELHKKWLNDEEGGVRANLREADLQGARLQGANLQGANLLGAYLQHARLQGANLQGADMEGADLRHARLQGANLQNAYLKYANLTNAIMPEKILKAKPGGIYYKRFNKWLINFDYPFKAGLNTLREGETFAADERITCSYPGFHFASKEWCDRNYSGHPLEALIRIPENAQINEPWTGNGQASSDMIEIIKVIDVATGTDVTEEYK